jgi:WD40 repeat protein
MVSSFRVMPEGMRLPRGAGLVMDWTQTSGTLLTAGDSRHIRLWDAHTENGVLVSAFIDTFPAGGLRSLLRTMTHTPIVRLLPWCQTM